MDKQAERMNDIYLVSKHFMMSFDDIMNMPIFEFKILVKKIKKENKNKK